MCFDCLMPLDYSRRSWSSDPTEVQAATESLTTRAPEGSSLAFIAGNSAVLHPARQAKFTGIYLDVSFPNAMIERIRRGRGRWNFNRSRPPHPISQSRGGNLSPTGRLG